MAKDNRRLNAQDTAALQNAEDQVGAIDAQAASFKKKDHPSTWRNLGHESNLG